jgi:RNA-directed DNA polymerase
MEVPPGSVLSPVLSNLYLHPFDRVVAQAGYQMGRYCNDLVLLGRTQAAAEATLALVQDWTTQHDLRLHPGKTRIVDSSKGGHGFAFLGYQFVSGRRYVRRQNLTALGDKIRQKMGRTRSGSLEQIITELNPVLRGWFGYFKHARFPICRTIDDFVRRRLRALLRKREKRPGFGGHAETISTGRRRSSPHMDFAPCRKPMCRRANPDEETINWKALCGRTACMVRRAGRVRALSDP